MTREQRLITVGLMAALAVSALDSTVVGTAMPTIIGQLGGLSEYAWVFSAYLLASTTTVPLYAKLADIHGRKPIFLIGMGLFVAGSALCGLAGSMWMLIAFRTLQGLGAGAVQPISFTIAGDIFEPRQRARMQGLFSGVWGVSAIIGPALGGLITSTIGWPWVFELNLPVGLLAGAIIGLGLHERFERHPHRIDWWGAALLSGSIVLLLFAVSEGGELFGWASAPFAAMVAGSAALFVLFVRNARRAEEPLVDLGLLRIPLMRAGLWIGTLTGIVMFGVTTFVPPLVQGVQGGTAVQAGAVVAAMSIGWPVGSIVSGRTLHRFGARPFVVVGCALILAGALATAQATRLDSLAFTTAACAVVGLGMGFSATVLLIMIQGVVPWQRRATATGLVQFSRTIGGSVGVGVMGGVLAAFVGTASSAILDPLGRTQLTPDQLSAGRDSLAAGLQVVYWVMTAAAAAALVLAVRTMPAAQLGEPASTELPPEPRGAASEPGAAPRAPGSAAPAPAGRVPAPHAESPHGSPGPRAEGSPEPAE
jgi:EmrB/QacA subfamily drug resistance transporter